MKSYQIPHGLNIFIQCLLVVVVKPLSIEAEYLNKNR